MISFEVERAAEGGGGSFNPRKNERCANCRTSAGKNIDKYQSIAMLQGRSFLRGSAAPEWVPVVPSANDERRNRGPRIRGRMRGDTRCGGRAAACIPRARGDEARTSSTSGRPRAGSTQPLCWTCTRLTSSAGRCRRAWPRSWWPTLLMMTVWRRGKPVALLHHSPTRAASTPASTSRSCSRSKAAPAE